MFANLRTRALAERVELTLDIGSNLPNIQGEETMLRKALDNLVDNAIKFTPPDGRVSILLRSDGRFVLIEITDTGVGIPPEEQERIFDQFYQIDGSTTRRYGGTGLGLALVKEIVKVHNGEISFTSSAGEGSTFQIKLPAMN
jgi:signal transduction histidine kinase